MSKAILGGTLTTQADGKTSTNALGEIHNEVRHDILVSDAAQIAATITRQILAPLAYLNCGVSDPALLPWFRFDTRQAEDIQVFADALPKLASVMDIPAAWAHEKLKIPQAGEGEKVLAVKPQAMPEPAALTASAKAEDGPGVKRVCGSGCDRRHGRPTMPLPTPLPPCLRRLLPRSKTA